MEFDGVVGNPPYQQSVCDSARNQHDMPVYHLFYDLAESISKDYALITPARFLTNSGHTPKNWNKKMLNSEHHKIIYYNPKSSDVFSNTDIKGGVVITGYNRDQLFKPITFFTPYPLLTQLALKVIAKNNDGIMSDIMYVQTKMNLDMVYADYPDIREKRPKSHQMDKAFDTDTFVLFSDLLSDIRNSSDDIELFGLLPGNKRASRFIDSKYVLNNDSTSTKLDKYKVLVPKSTGSGIIGETISTPVIGTPGMGHTRSFRSIGAFDSIGEAECLLTYIKTKFARSMLGTLKSTQDMPPKVFSNVPLQDFTSDSDIDWTKSIAEIDQQLYAKYDLSNDEIAFIEEKVKPMT